MTTRREALIASAGMVSTLMLRPRASLAAVLPACAVVVSGGYDPQGSAPATNGGAEANRLLNVRWSTGAGLERFSAAEAASRATRANDSLANEVARGTIDCGLATVSLREPQAAASEARRALAELGLGGIAVRPDESSRSMDDPEFAPLYDVLARSGRPMLLISEPGLDLAAHCYGPLSASLAAARALTRLMLGGIFDRWPELQVVANLGDAISYWPAYFDQLHRSQLRLGATVGALQPSQYLKNKVFTTTAGLTSANSLRLAEQTFGTDGIMWSQPPFASGSRGAEWFARLPHADQQAVNFATARRLFMS